MLVKVVSISLILISIVFSGFRQIAEKNGVSFPSFDGRDLELHETPKVQVNNCGWLMGCKDSNSPDPSLWGRWLGESEQTKLDTDTHWYNSFKRQAASWFDGTETKEDSSNKWWGPGIDASTPKEDPKGWLRKSDPSVVKTEQQKSPPPPEITLDRESSTADERAIPEPVNSDNAKMFTIKIVMVPQFRNIWNKAGQIFQRIKQYSEYLSTAVVFITLPYAIVYLIQFQTRKAAKAPLNYDFPEVLSYVKTEHSLSSVALDKPEITFEGGIKVEENLFYPRSYATQYFVNGGINGSETSIDEKLGLLSAENTAMESPEKETGLNLEVLAKTVEYLQKKCRQQEDQLLKKSSELEEMARTVEYLQRPGQKRWIGLINRVPVYHSRFPALANMRYYQFHVPVEVDGKNANSEELKIGNSEEELSAREESDVSDSESCSELEWG